MIPYGHQDITQADVDAVVAAVTSDYLTQGPLVPRFERAIADHCGTSHAVAVNSGTSALHVACMTLGLGPGDWLWTSPITFVASANCALYCGARVDFVDIDARTWNLSVGALKSKLVAAAASGRLPKVVVPVHLGGQSCDMREIHALAQQYGFKVIEDASHALGGSYLGQPIGNCRFSDITILSFHPVKTITTAEGGMALTNDAGLAERMARLRSHGITRDASEMTHEPDGPWYYQQIELGYNYRMTELHAALGLSQAQRLDVYVDRRHAIADRYDAELAGLPLTPPVRLADRRSGLHLYVIRLQLRHMHRTHRDVFDSLREQGIGVNLHYIPVHLQPWYARMGFKRGDFPEAERYYAEALSLPIFPALTDEEQARVIAAVARAVGG